MTGKRAGFARERRDIIAACRQMNGLGINQGTVRQCRRCA